MITDLYSRKIVGWSLGESLSLEGALQALMMALKGRKQKDLAFIHHSDRCIQYCSKSYVTALHKDGIKISVTEENHCYENATAERVTGVLKDEFYMDSIFNNKSQAHYAVCSAIHTYNEKRPHWALSLLTPEVVNSQKVA